MTNTKRPALLPTLAWSLVVLLLLFIFFALLVGPALRTGGMGVPAGYAPNQPPRDLTEYPATKGSNAPGINLAKAVAGDPAELTWAKEEYGKICVACHGPEGKGDGPAGLALGARDFTQNSAWKNGPKLTQIFTTLSKGLPPKMPSYDTYTPSQRLALAHVVQGFMKFAVPAANAAEIAAMDQEYSLSAGDRQPGKVPVRVAVELASRNVQPVRVKMEALPADLRPLVVDALAAGQTVTKLGAESPASFAASLTAGAPANGFSGGVASLGAADWQRLRAACQAALEPVKL